MRHSITRLTALLIFLSLASSVIAAKRILLPPPDGYKGVEIHGTKYVVGQVYVPQFSDSNKLKDYGFRGFEAIGSTHTYKKIKAIWPLDTDLHALPEWISGVTYEKARSVDEMQRAYAADGNKPPNINSVGTLFNVYGNQYNNYGGYMVVQESYTPPGSPFYRLNNYGFYNDSYGRNRTFNDCGLRYRTCTPTKLTPTTIGSYGQSRYNRGYGSYCR